MISHTDIEAMITALPGVVLDYPFGEGVAVYRVESRDLSLESKGLQSASSLQSPVSKSKMFALIQEGSSPVRLSLKCDPGLAELLREKYESVVPGYHLNKKHWNTIICSGQVPDDELRDLVRHSYELVIAS